MATINDLERRTRSLPPIIRQAGWRALKAAQTPRELARWVRLKREYAELVPGEKLQWRDAQLEIVDRLSSTPFDRHYFYQDSWAAQRIAELAPERHVDIGSRVDFVGFMTAICPVTFVDIRPLQADLENLECIAGSLLDLPYEDQSLHSVSCLHVIEHVGLGRYGDPLDPQGSRSSLVELQRVVAPGGQLLVSTPVGRPRTCWNAHRIHNPADIVSMLDELELLEFSGVDDDGVFRRHRELSELSGQVYACGMFRLRRPA